MLSTQVICEQRSEGQGRNQLSEKVKKRISGRNKIKSKGLVAGKSLLTQGFQRRPKGLSAAGREVGKAGGHRQSSDFSPKASESS